MYRKEIIIKKCIFFNISQKKIKKTNIVVMAFASFRIKNKTKNNNLSTRILSGHASQSRRSMVSAVLANYRFGLTRIYKTYESQVNVEKNKNVDAGGTEPRKVALGVRRKGEGQKGGTRA